VTAPVGRQPDQPAPVETQPERTALAWQRTGLGVMAVAGLLGHRALEEEQPTLLVVAGSTALLGLAILGGLAPFRYRRVRRGVAAGDVPAARRSAAAVTIAVVLAAVAAFVGIVTPH
jgi:putative membrane protein